MPKKTCTTLWIQCHFKYQRKHLDGQWNIRQPHIENWLFKLLYCLAKYSRFKLAAYWQTQFLFSMFGNLHLIHCMLVFVFDYIHDFIFQYKHILWKEFFDHDTIFKSKWNLIHHFNSGFMYMTASYTLIYSKKLID